MKTEMISEFLEKYGHEPKQNYFTPGRVNLIGEHIDYNGGLVMPCAVTLGTWLSIAPNNDKVIRFKSLNFPEEREFDLQPSYTKTGPEWYNYPLGVFHEILKKHQIPTGLDLLFHGNIPIGSGLSSSASIEVAMAYALNDYFNLGYEKIEIPLLAQKVENEFIGVNCGIMDQFAVAFGETDKAIVLNCDTLKYKIVDCSLGDYSLAIINTNKPRKLAESKYNERVAECQTALKQLNQEITLHNLCELNADKFALHSHLITDPTVLKRATHVIRENDRVNLAAKALNEGNLTEFGRLMYASHQSLKELYEVTGAELDAVVEFCSAYAHVIGARMTGAGFGGCAIALLKKGREEDFAKKLNDFYVARIGYPAAIYISEIGNGASAI
ncbi:galactokinase [Pedobacter heparinus]|uniref:Galactokinase n=1 Tax=Pedobacter heparinus (strain ATCC 13125 / DSM 2366 / CIP 104194 / JCM 7457 / NBRC 12017 / NCIMB 9290 / NRRL B-14731 / HIM 762-3) TaxID=485917 RepID=C6XXS0_PEDHD|nr:galactokinase [Pedobacter heparinus]ACU04338.1 galactokinase [Pedobacter heparinus DSM 2366]